MTSAPTYLCQMKPYIQPFEKQLALRELEALAGHTPVPQFDVGTRPLRYQVQSWTPANVLAYRLAYWESVADPSPRWTRQLLVEATTSLARNGRKIADLSNCLPFSLDSVTPPSRRILRYGPHGIHEYRGKFFPQLVRALINIANLPEGSFILDPMCGSGTTLVEASLMDCRALGLDLNPLSAFISRVKCQVLGLSPKVLLQEYDCLQQRLSAAKVEYDKPDTWQWYLGLSPIDQQYLSRWFSSSVLAELETLVTAIRQVDYDPCEQLFWVCLSDTLRAVSWQKDDDLRVRRELYPVVPGLALQEFTTRLDSNVKYLLAFLLQESNHPHSRLNIMEGDARTIDAFVDKPVDAVITSPPYATALPYLDTDRLSLIYLKLLTRDRHRARDYQMIGNREITDSMRLRLWNDFQSRGIGLPSEVRKMINNLSAVYHNNTEIGFRRRNLPSLIARYFEDMTLVLRGIWQNLRFDGHVFIVVGDNHTVADGVRIDIPTTFLLEEVARGQGFQLVETIPMEMLPPRDIFSRNSVASENIIHLVKCPIQS